MANYNLDGPGAAVSYQSVVRFSSSLGDSAEGTQAILSNSEFYPLTSGGIDLGRNANRWGVIRGTNILLVNGATDVVFQTDAGATSIAGLLLKNGGGNKWQVLSNLDGGATFDFTIRHAISGTLMMRCDFGTGETRFGAAIVNFTHSQAGFGYGAGAGGTTTQPTSKATSVLLDKVAGEITLNNSALASNTTTSFQLKSAAISPLDLIHLQHMSFGSVGSYLLSARPFAGSAEIVVRNVTPGSLSESMVVKYAVMKGVVS